MNNIFIIWSCLPVKKKERQNLSSRFFLLLKLIDNKTKLSRERGVVFHPNICLMSYKSADVSFSMTRTLIIDHTNYLFG